MEAFYILNHWHWWALAALLVVGEILGPCVYFLALGIAAAVVGLVVRFMPGLGGLWQLGLFIVLSAIALALAKRVRQQRAKATPPSAGKLD
jgi:membrane protein implicated in regulation of membrane protease activity